MRVVHLDHTLFSSEIDADSTHELPIVWGLKLRLDWDLSPPSSCTYIPTTWTTHRRYRQEHYCSRGFECNDSADRIRAAYCRGVRSRRQTFAVEQTVPVSSSSFPAFLQSLPNFTILNPVSSSRLQTYPLFCICFFSPNKCVRLGYLQTSNPWPFKKRERSRLERPATRFPFHVSKYTISFAFAHFLQLNPLRLATFKPTTVTR